MSNKDLYEYALSLGDNALILGQRLAEWCGHSPALELDIAVTNLSLDLIGEAQLYLDYAAEVEGEGKSADDLAYLRDCLKFRNYLLLEQPNKNWGRTTVRLFLYSTFMALYLEQLQNSKDEQLSAIAGKAIKEVLYHKRFSSEWMLRLGDGTDESKAYVQKGLEDMWRFTGELFAMSDGEKRLCEAGIAVDAASLEAPWNAEIDAILVEAGLIKPPSQAMIMGRFKGHHSEHLGHILSEMQFLQRAYPGAKW
ncbi:MAG: phenylacetate-CoA oxygenase subunit PaaC [Sphingomonadales bacterium]|nr:phenylacetate-CoA oxygenase subunit PaaC [Sphingomonadales bacterium]